jgi:hypothetical protein
VKTISKIHIFFFFCIIIKIILSCLIISCGSTSNLPWFITCKNLHLGLHHLWSNNCLHYYSATSSYCLQKNAQKGPTKSFSPHAASQQKTPFFFFFFFFFLFFKASTRSYTKLLASKGSIPQCMATCVDKYKSKQVGPTVRLVKYKSLTLQVSLLGR